MPTAPVDPLLLSIDQLLALAVTEQQKRVIDKGSGSGKVRLVDARNPAKSTEITAEAADLRCVQAAAIMLAESGGHPLARNQDSPVPAGSPPWITNNNAPGKGTDRGVWQWNDKAHPDISDAAAYDPAFATAAAYMASDGFTAWGPWTGSKGLDHAGTQYRAVLAAYQGSKGVAVDDTPGPGSVAEITQLGWVQQLGKLLGYITSAAFWRRFGIGALGVLFILIAVALTVAAAKLKA